METLEQRVIAIVAQQLKLNESEVRPEASFQDDFGCDSLDTMDLVMAFEDAFNITIPDNQAEQITTVQKAIDFIASQQQA